ASATRDEGLVKLFRTEPRTTPIQSFRFRVALQDDDIATWKRFGAETNVPLRAVLAPGDLRTAQRSFLEISDSRVHVLAFKRSLSNPRSEEHTSELQSLRHLVCRLLLEKKKQSLKLLL